MNKKNTNPNDFYFIFYAVPFLSSISIAIFFDRVLTIIYGHRLTGWQAQGVALLFLVFSFIILYDLFVKIPKQKGGKKKIKEVVLLFFKSSFFLSWMLANIVVFFATIYKLKIFMIIYLVILIICYINQRSFIKKLDRLYKNKC